ncbi:PAS domain-containing protein [Rubrobacter radiotolerans]|uniref:PAS domain-containing protein n=1 Tax=Rubrobacter radiotolerans TaxID=42256 RepID=UPI00056EEEC2|nr:PAS domain-containing protein [Rubrobacter radiotolerans]
MRGFEGDNFRDFREGSGITSGAWERRDVEEMRRLLDRAVAASVNGIVISDPSLPDNPVIYVNSAFERTTGYTRDEVVGKKLPLSAERRPRAARGRGA